MGAVFPPGIAVGRERLPAPGAGEGIDRPLPYPIRMPVPPFLPALPGAEHPFLHAFRLPQGLPAFPAESVLRAAGRLFLPSCRFPRQPVPPAEAPHRVPRQPHLPCYHRISSARRPQARDLAFLFICHQKHLLPYATAVPENGRLRKKYLSHIGHGDG